MNIKEEVKAQLTLGLPESSLDKIENNSNISWVEKGKEFLFNGTLYDIVTTKQVNGKMVFYCLNDQKEKQLLKNAVKAVEASNDNTTGSNGGKQVIKFQLSDFTAPVSAALQPVHILTTNKYLVFGDALVSVNREIHTPPPRV